MIRSQPLQGLWNGVSQQPAHLRFENQVESSVNILHSVVDGAIDRPPSQFVAEVDTGPLGPAYVHSYNRDANERYIVIIQDEAIRVFHLDTGEEKTVAYLDGTSYLASSSPEDDFAAVTVADYTFIVNKTVVVADDPTQTEGAALTGRKQRFRDVTDIESPAEGQIYEVAGDDNTAFDNFYVRRTSGVWREWVKPGITNGLDAATMPHVLVRNGDGSFTFKQADWDAREVGDEESAPMPSFVGKTINSVIFHRNRLGVLSGQNAVLTRAGQFFNWFRSTVTDLLDTDPIDIAAPGTDVSVLRHAVGFSNVLMITADQNQFALSGGDFLSPKTVAIDQTTSYEVDARVAPCSAGSNVYLAAKRGGYSSVHEYFVADDSLTTDASEVTTHVPSYVPSPVVKMVSSANNDILFVLTEADRTKLYVYRWYWSGDKKAQSAWDEWTFSGNVKSITTADNHLVALVERDESTVLEKINLQHRDHLDAALNYSPLLDRITRVTGTYDAPNDRTVWEIPYTLSSSVSLELVLTGDHPTHAGLLASDNMLKPYATLSRLSDTQVALPGDYTGDAWVGIPYERRTRLSEFIYRAQDRPVLGVHVMLQSLVLRYQDTGYFRVAVSVNNLPMYELTVLPEGDPLGRVLGSASVALDQPALGDGQVALSVYGPAKYTRVDIINDTPLPCLLASGEWTVEVESL